MDPLTIFASTAAVSKVLWNCSNTLSLFINRVSVVDENIKALHREAEGLRRTLTSIMQSLQTPLLATNDRLPLWDDVNACLIECNATLSEFSEKLRKMGPAPATKGNVFASTAQAFKMHFKEEDIRTLRAQIQSHAFSMQMVLQMITVHISSTTPHVVLDELAPQLRTLMTLVVDIHKTTIPAEAFTPGIRRSRTRLERSARELASKASVVVTSQSTACSVSQMDQGGPATWGVNKQSTTTGSELGEPLSLEARHRISEWMSNEASDNKSALTISERSPSAFSEPREGSLESHTTPGEVYSPGKRPKGIRSDSSGEADDSDEVQFELEVAQRYIIEGRKRAQTNPAKAEEFLRKAVLNLQSIKTAESLAQIPQITFEMGVVCFQQDKVLEAIELATQLLRNTPVDDRSRALVLQASHLLSQVYLRTGQYDAALRQCKRTLNGRRRLRGKHNDYFDSLALMSTIYRHKGDEIESLTYESLLPAEFSRSEFKPPEPSLSKVPEDPNEPVEKTMHEARDGVPISPLIECGLAANSKALEVVKRTVSEDSSTFRAAKLAKRSKCVDDVNLSTSKECNEAIKKGSEADTLKLPRAMAARMNTAKALATTFSAHTPNASTNPVEILTLRPASATDSSRKPRLLQREQQFIKQAEQESALNTLERHGRTSFAMADIEDHFLWAASSGHESVVRLLLSDWIYHKKIPDTGRHGRRSQKMLEVQRTAVDINVANDRGYSALHLAAANEQSNMVKILLDRGAIRCNRTHGTDEETKSLPPGLGQTPIECAIATRNVETVECFRPLSADDRELNHLGQSLLHHASVSGNQRIVDIILEEKFDIEAKSHDGTTALHMASITGNYNVIDLLISRGANVNVKDTDGSSPLSCAVQAGFKRCFRRLVGAGADLRTRNSQRFSLMHVAAQHGHLDMLGAIVFKALEIDCRNSAYQTPLHLAMEFGQIDAVDALLALGADIDAKDNHGNAPIHLAVSTSPKALVEHLLTAGAKADSTNNAGRTPVMIATINRREDLIPLLKSHQRTSR